VQRLLGLLAEEIPTMVGKPNVPVDAAECEEEEPRTTGHTPGLSPLDWEREASMADEGGASGAVLEGEDPLEVQVAPTAHRPFPHFEEVIPPVPVVVPPRAPPRR
jgi:hypothetical protein